MVAAKMAQMRAERNRARDNFEMSSCNKEHYPEFCRTVREKTLAPYAPVKLSPKKRGEAPVVIHFEQRILDRETMKTVKGNKEFKPLEFDFHPDDL